MSLLSWHVAGQKVICIDDMAWGLKHPRPLRECLIGPCIAAGEIYEITKAVVFSDGDVCLHLLEFPGPGRWPSLRFRPVRATSIECFRSFLTPTPSQAREMENA